MPFCNVDWSIGWQASSVRRTLGGWHVDLLLSVACLAFNLDWLGCFSEVGTNFWAVTDWQCLASPTNAESASSADDSLAIATPNAIRGG